MYVIDKNPENPGIKRADASLNFSLRAVIDPPRGEIDNYLELTGGIVNGRLAVTIKKPDENILVEAASWWNIPEEYFTVGAEIKIGSLSLETDGTIDSNYYSSRLFLIENPEVNLNQGEARSVFLLDSPAIMIAIIYATPPASIQHLI